MERVWWRASLPGLAVIVLTFIAYWPALGGGYIWDDGELIVKNPDVRAEAGLLRVWFNRKSVEYLPLTYDMHWLEWRLFHGSAAGPHVINVLLHGLSAVLLGIILRRLGVPGAWLAALLFALHPVAVASAAWLSERKNMLSMVFYLGSILAYLRFDVRTHHDDTTGTTNGTAYYLLSLALFLLALLSKTSVVMLPAVLLLLAWWRRGRVTRADLLRTVPFFALSLALGLVTVWFQWHAAIGGTHDLVRPEGASSRIAAAGWIAGFYLWKILLPVKLCAIYPRWAVDGTRLLSFVPLALLMAATGLLWSMRKRWGRGPLAAWACFLVSLLPVLGLVDMAFMRLSLVADHLQYVAMPAILAAGAALLARARAGAGAGRAVTVALGICLAAMAALTFQRAGVFNSEQRLWRDAVEKTPDSAQAWSHLGIVYFHAGALDEAIRCYDTSLELDPRYAEAHLKRGNVYAVAKRFAEAIRDYDQAIALQPDFAGAYYNRGNVHAAARRYAEAIQDYDRAIALKPDFAEAWLDRSAASLNIGRPEEALRDLDRAIEINPDFAEAYVNRGLILVDTHRYAEAIRDYDRALALEPEDAEAWFDRGTAHASAGHIAEALRDLDRAIALKPDDADAWFNRAKAFEAAGRPAEAVRDYTRAIKLRPGDPDAYYNRAILLRRLKQYRAALEDFRRVRNLGGTVPEELLRSPGPAEPPPR